MSTAFGAANCSNTNYYNWTCSVTGLYLNFESYNITISNSQSSNTGVWKCRLDDDDAMCTSN